MANYCISSSITSSGNGIWYVVFISNFIANGQKWYGRIWLYNIKESLIYLGATTSIQNFGLTFIGFAAGVIVDQDETYVWLEIFYIAWLIVAILITVLLWFLDYRQHNYLFMTEKEKKVFETTPEYYKMMRMDIPKSNE